MQQVETPCKPCKGTGKCKKCGGRGIAEVGFLSKKVVDCPDCAATGKCRDCGGSGQRVSFVPEGNEPIWSVMQRQAEAANAKNGELRAREESLMARGIDPGAPEFEPMRKKHMLGPIPENNAVGASGNEPIWEVMARQAEQFQRRSNYLAELEEIARQRGL
jgi:uncharacterized membrane protein